MAKAEERQFSNSVSNSVGEREWRSSTLEQWYNESHESYAKIIWLENKVEESNTKIDEACKFLDYRLTVNIIMA